jgi:hypothetical protein
MGGFTRLLHSGEADDLMDEVPTFVAQPLPNSVVEHEAYPVLNRPYAFLQWIKVGPLSFFEGCWGKWAQLHNHGLGQEPPTLLRGEASEASTAAALHEECKCVLLCWCLFPRTAGHKDHRGVYSHE